MLIDLISGEFSLVRHLFESHTRGRAMLFGCSALGLGSMKTDSKKDPTIALFLFPPISYIAGDSTSPEAKNLIRDIPALTITVVSDDAWIALIQDEWGEKIRTQPRTRLCSESLDIAHLRKLKIALPSEFSLQKIDLVTMNNSDKSFWEGLLYFFGSYEKFLENGFGYCIKKGQQTVSVAYTAFPFENDFEIQVSTLDDPEFRRKGLATIVSAALIEDGLLREVVPHWDAANQASVHLALKLGYTDPDPYDVYYWKDSQ